MPANQEAFKSCAPLKEKCLINRCQRKVLDQSQTTSATRRCQETRSCYFTHQQDNYWVWVLIITEIVTFCFVSWKLYSDINTNMHNPKNTVTKGQLGEIQQPQVWAYSQVEISVSKRRLYSNFLWSILNSQELETTKVSVTAQAWIFWIGLH